MMRTVVWSTELSESGRSTPATGLSDRLRSQGAHVSLLDGDAVHVTGARRLGFSPADIIEHGRRVIDMYAAARE